jgi:hypothetical protein
LPTIRKLEEALAKTRPSPEAMEKMRWPGEGSVPALDREAMDFFAEKESAPIVTRDILLDVLAEARATTRLARWTLFVASVTLVVSGAGVAIALLAS